MNTDKLKHKDITDIIIKCFYEVYNELGHGFLEAVYDKALSIVLSENGLKVESQKGIDVFFRGHSIGEYRADLLVDDIIIIEVKAVQSINAAHVAQLINYLKATSIEVGLLLNFGNKPEFKRLLFDNNRKISDKVLATDIHG